jgi:hypothetical protein
MNLRGQALLISYGSTDFFRRVSVLAHRFLRENLVGEYAHPTRLQRRG